MTLEEAKAEAKRRWGEQADAGSTFSLSGTSKKEVFVVGFTPDWDECWEKRLSVLPFDTFQRLVPRVLGSSFEDCFAHVDRVLAQSEQVKELLAEEQAILDQRDLLEAKLSKISNQYSAIVGRL